MGDEKDPSASNATEVAPAAVPSSPVSVAPRPVSIPPRPLGGSAPTSRMPPPPSSRGILPGQAQPGALRSPPPPPLRNPSAAPSAPFSAVPPSAPVSTASPSAFPSPSTPAPLPPDVVTSAGPVSTVAASPSVMPRVPATPPPPPQRASAPPSFARPLTQSPGVSATAQLEQRLGATQVELRKLGSERHTLRARLRREADRLRELESALRAEKELRSQASEEHFAAILGLRTRMAEVEAERDAETARLQAELAQLRAELQTATEALERASAAPTASGSAPPAAGKPSKVLTGLRRIRGIGPAYQRVLEQAGVTRVQQIAAWTDADVLAFAERLKIRPERITKDDWIGQAKALGPDA